MLPLILVIFRMVRSPPRALFVVGVGGTSDSASERSGFNASTRGGGEASTTAGAGIDFRRLLRATGADASSIWRRRAL